MNQPKPIEVQNTNVDRQHENLNSKPITVLVRGGVVQDIQNIPNGITVHVRDYDIDSLTEEERLKETEPDEDGNPCVVAIWNPAAQGGNKNETNN